MQEAIKKVVAFWVAVAFSQEENWDNGSPEQGGGGMMAILGNMNAISARNTVSEEQKGLFAEILTNKLEESDYHDLHCDYHPEGLLLDAAKEAGIPSSCFPCKTSTQIRQGVAYGKCGYGKPMEEL